MGIEYGISFRAVDMGSPPQGYRIDDGAVSNQKVVEDSDSRFRSNADLLIQDVATNLVYGWERTAKLSKCQSIALC